MIEEEENEDIEDLQSWTKNKMRGFRRVDPSQPASKNTGKNETAANPSKEEEARRLRAPGGSHPTTGTPPTPPTLRNLQTVPEEIMIMTTVYTRGSIATSL